MPRPFSNITDPLTYLVESSGGEVGVTILVDGVVIDGILTPLLQYEQWQTDQANIAIEVAPGLLEPIEMTSERPSAEMRARVVEEWAERCERAGVAPTEILPVSFEFICLRDAIIANGPESALKIIAYLKIKASAVSALSMSLRHQRG